MSEIDFECFASTGAEELTELVEKWESETGIAAQLDLHAGEGGLQVGYQAQQHGHDAGMTGGVSRTQARRQQASGVTLEDQHGVIHMLAVSSEAESAAVRRVLFWCSRKKCLAWLACLAENVQ